MVSFKFLTALAAFAPSVLAHPAADVSERAVDGRTLCKAEPSPEFLADAAAFSALEATYDNSSRLNIQAEGARAAPIVVQTYFHVVARSTAASGGYVSQTQLNNQLNVLNQNYAASGISFVLAGTDYTVNANWASDGDELGMKRALRKGNYAALNVYFLYDASGALGYCQFPKSAPAGSTAFIQDGCTVLYSTVPGGSLANYNQGKTTTHEVGHWFGLLHTFQGNSCTGSGDQVSDTPAQLSSTSGCPTGRDSCPNQPGLDPINNYMDYSYDRCYTQFTAGQITRMTNMWNTYRA